MYVLWAPWRMEYILKEAGGCIFCQKPREARDVENYILHRGSTCFVMLNRFPYNNGHLMVVPYKHVPSLEDLDDGEALELMKTIAFSIRCLQEATKPHGFNVGLNIGKVAGAGFEGHVHVHVVPRWEGDTNFMPVFADTKVVSEALQTTFNRLKDTWTRLGLGSRDEDEG